MKDRIHSAAGLAQTVRVGDVAQARHECKAAQIVEHGRRPVQDMHFLATPIQFAHQPRADESRRASYQNSHRRLYNIELPAESPALASTKAQPIALILPRLDEIIEKRTSGS